MRSAMGSTRGTPSGLPRIGRRRWPGRRTIPGSMAAKRYHHPADDVPDGLHIPKWSWQGLIGEAVGGELP